MVGPEAKRSAVAMLLELQKFKRHRACRLAGLGESTYYYKPSDRRSDEPLKAKLVEFSQLRPRWGCPRIFDLARRNGLADNYKRIERIYSEAGLSLKLRRRKKKKGNRRLVLTKPTKANEIWSMDFMQDQLFDGRRFRTFNVVDEFTRENLVIDVNRSIRSLRVVEILNQVIKLRGKPNVIICDNGPEFDSQAVDVWAFQNGVKISFIDPGKPVQNAYIESFNGKFRDECLDANWFTCLEHARLTIEVWRHDYNHHRPHSSLNYKTPNEFAKEQEAMLAS